MADALKSLLASASSDNCTLTQQAFAVHFFILFDIKAVGIFMYVILPECRIFAATEQAVVFFGIMH